MATTIPVGLAERSYEIHVGPGLLAKAGRLVAPFGRRLFVVTDENVAAHHLETLKAAFDEIGLENHGVILPAGEQTKDFLHLESLVDSMLDAGSERSTLIVAFGGGVIGDLTGFAASILLRGVPFVQIPTTLLSQVDSSVGGKTGINTGKGKNLVGSFHQPKLVLADLDVLETLPEREFAAGYAEMVKYGALGDIAFFDWLEENGRALFAQDKAALEQAVAHCCRAKAAIVAADERESGVRAHLNLGHTFAHILEAESGYGSVLNHGEAVSIGMVMAFTLSAQLGLCPAGDAARLERHLAGLGLPVRPPAHPNGAWDVPALVARLAADKKARNGKVAFILARRLGEVFSTADVPPARVQDLIAAFVA